MTQISGFHEASETDPFAAKGVLASVASPVAGLAGARATVMVSCGSDIVHGPYLYFQIAMEGRSLDIVTKSNVHETINLIAPSQYSTQDRYVALGVRVDDQEPESAYAPATDDHHAGILYEDIHNASVSKKLLLGFSSNGSDATLQLNLREPKLASLIRRCEQAPIEAKKQEADELTRQKAGAFEQGCRSAGGGGKIMPPQMLDAPAPESTPESRKAQFVGDVQVSLVVDATGRPTNIKVTKGVGMGLDEKAIEAVSRYKFKPAMQNCHAVSIPLTIGVNFQPF